MIATPAIRNVIREGKLEQIRSYLESGARMGMHTMDTSLADLVRMGRLDADLARAYLHNPKAI